MCVCVCVCVIVYMNMQHVCLVLGETNEDIGCLADEIEMCENPHDSAGESSPCSLEEFGYP